MAIHFLLFSILGVLVVAAAGSIAVATLFVEVALIYGTEIPTQFGVFRGQRLVGLWQFLTGIWLMYLTYATVFNIAWVGIGGPKNHSRLGCKRPSPDSAVPFVSSWFFFTPETCYFESRRNTLIATKMAGDSFLPLLG